MAKITLNKTQKIISIIVAIILALVIAAGVYCVSTKQTPAEAVKTMFSTKDERIIGKWQSQTSPGLSAYVFNDDGTYDSYISVANFSGDYEVKGNKLYLKNPKTSKEIVYKFTVNEKELKLEVVEEDGNEPEEKDVSVYDRVEELNQKTLTDLLGEIKQSSETTTEE